MNTDEPIPASEIEAIRGRHINKHDDPDFSEDDGYAAHNDRWTLLRALDAMAEENARLKGAVAKVEATWRNMPAGSPERKLIVDGACYVLDDLRAALKEPGQ